MSNRRGARSGEAQGEFRVAFGRDPKKIVRAVTLFPEIFDAQRDPNLYDIIAAIHVASKIKDDDQATQLYSDYLDYKSYDTLRDIIKTANARPAKPPKPAPTCERCERVKAMYDLALTGGYVADRPAATQSKILEALRAALYGEVTP